MRVLLTGASSFTGSWIARALAAAGAEVTAVCRGRPEAYDAARRDRIEAIAASAEIVPGVPFGGPDFLAVLENGRPFDVLCLHHAEVGDFRRSDFAPLDAAAANTRGLDAVLAVATGRGMRRLVHTGTVFESGEGQGDLPLEPIGPYGLAKSLTSSVIRFAVARAGLAAVKVTIPSPFGPGQGGGFVDYLVRNWQAGTIPVLDHPDRVRDFVPVSFLADHYAAIALGRHRPAAGDRSSPSFFVETVEAFARRLAGELGPRLDIACPLLSCQPPKASTEPARRFNTDPLPQLGQEQALAAFWDELARWYRCSKSGVIAV